MRKILSLILLVALAVGVTMPATARPPKRGDKMLPIKAAQVFNNEHEVDLKDLEGYIVVVEFWATWCGPCKKSIPHLNEMHKKYQDEGVVIIGISDEDAGKVKNFMKSTKMDYLVIAGSSSNRDYGVRGIPDSFLIGPDGKVAWNGHPMNGLDRELEKLMKKSPATRSLGGGPDHNERVLSKAEEALRAGAMDVVLANTRRVDKDALNEREDHPSRYRALEDQLTQIAQADFNLAMNDAQSGYYSDAFKALNRIAREYKGLSIAKKAEAEIKKLENNADAARSQRMEALERYASNSLKRAKRQMETDKVNAYRRLQLIVEKYKGTDSATEAQKMIDELEADGDFMKQIDK